MGQVVRRGQGDAHEVELGRPGVHHAFHAGDASDGTSKRVPTESHTLGPFRPKLLLQIGEEKMQLVTRGTCTLGRDERQMQIRVGLNAREPLYYDSVESKVKVRINVASTRTQLS